MAKILVTDDSMFMRNMIKTMIASEGYETCEAGNGKQMLEVYEKELPDVVTLDITMPEMDGLEALRLLRKKHPDAKVVMCSAMGQQAMVIEAIQAGAVNFLVKPFEKEKVLESLHKIIGDIDLER